MFVNKSILNVLIQAEKENKSLRETAAYLSRMAGRKRPGEAICVINIRAAAKALRNREPLVLL